MEVSNSNVDKPQGIYDVVKEKVSNFADGASRKVSETFENIREAVLGYPSSVDQGEIICEAPHTNETRLPGGK